MQVISSRCRANFDGVAMQAQHIDVRPRSLAACRLVQASENFFSNSATNPGYNRGASKKGAVVSMGVPIPRLVQAKC